jgi:hypothetical protein
MMGQVVSYVARFGVPLALTACAMGMDDAMSGAGDRPSSGDAGSSAGDAEPPLPLGPDAGAQTADGDSMEGPPDMRIGPGDPPLPQPICLDGEDHGRILQCDEEVSCLRERRCCLDLINDWINTTFDGCPGEGGDSWCGWELFSSRADSISFEEISGAGAQWALLAPTGYGESGLHSRELVPFAGGVTLTFAAALESTGCHVDGCSQSLGVGLTDQEVVSVGTGVHPAAAIVLDGESGAIHFMVNGRIEGSSSLESTVELTVPRSYRLKLEADGTVSFWRGSQVTLEAPGSAVFDSDPDFTSRSRLLSPSTRGRPVLFGRAHQAEAGGGRVAAVAIERALCDDPDGFGAGQRVDNLIAPGQEATALGRPAVAIDRSGYQLCLVYEQGGFLAAATSSDGRQWTRQGDLFVGMNLPFDYGRVAHRSPALVAGQGDKFHLWLELWAETTSPAGHPRVAIAYGGAAGCGEWNLDHLLGENDLFTGSLGEPSGEGWMAEVGEPSVVCLESEPFGGACTSFELYFVGTDAQGLRNLAVAHSPDGVGWADVERLDFIGSGEAAPFERDGWAFPTALRRGSVTHLWYTGFHGASSAIGYAVRTEREGLALWERLGSVFTSGDWEQGRVLAPAVVAVPWQPDGGLSFETVSLQLLYVAGAAGRERLGWASRLVPASD